MASFTPRPTILPLQLASGWKQVPARACGNRLVWENGYDLYAGETDFQAPVYLGRAGGVDCPVAVDPARSKAYRYCCQIAIQRKDFSQIREFDVHSGDSQVLFQLGLNQWVVWLCRLLPSRKILLALVATDARSQNLNIYHQLGLFNLEKRRSLLVPLCRDAYCPLAVDPVREEILFHGAEGYHLVDLSGRRRRKLSGQDIPVGRGAGFHPREPIVALGGAGLLLWNTRKNDFQTLRQRGGQYPLWDNGGEALWFSLSSADLWRFDMQTGTQECIARVAANRHPEINYSRPFTLTADGRYLAALLSRKSYIKTEARPNGERKERFRMASSLCVFDLQNREVWQYPCSARNFSWVDNGMPA